MSNQLVFIVALWQLPRWRSNRKITQTPDDFNETFNHPDFLIILAVYNWHDCAQNLNIKQLITEF